MWKRGLKCVGRMVTGTLSQALSLLLFIENLFTLSVNAPEDWDSASLITHFSHKCHGTVCKHNDRELFLIPPPPIKKFLCFVILSLVKLSLRFPHFTTNGLQCHKFSFSTPPGVTEIYCVSKNDTPYYTWNRVKPEMSRIQWTSSLRLVTCLVNSWTALGFWAIWVSKPIICVYLSFKALARLGNEYSSENLANSPT